MGKRAASTLLFAVVFSIVSLSCATKPAIKQVNLIGTEWERTNPPIDRYILVFTDKSNCMYVYPKTIHKRSYTIKGNKITIAEDTYEIEGDTLYYKGEIYFVRINKK